ncbi:MAG: hemerythrin domain-containing protein [Pseudomonadales bacterium]
MIENRKVTIMHPLMQQLYEDHHHMQRLLYCLQKEVSYFEAGKAAEAELSLILDAMDYFQLYPEKWHHPVEDVIFEILLTKNISESAMIQEIVDEHLRLEKMTQREKALFNAISHGSQVPTAELIDVHREFVAAQAGHIERENHQIYPLIRKYMTDADWQVVETRMATPADPLFGDNIREDYQALYQRIVDSEHET